MIEYIIAVCTFLLAGSPMLGIDINYNKFKNKFIRISFVIILVVAFGVYSYAFWQRKGEENDIKNTTKKTATKVDEINDDMTKIDNVNKDIKNKQDSLLGRLNSLNQSSEALLISVDKSQNIYAKLEKQAYRDHRIREKEFNERAANVVVIHRDIEFVLSSDSLGVSFSVPITNNGKRNLLLNEARGLLLMTDKNGDISNHYIFNLGNSIVIPPSNVLNMGFERFPVNIYKNAKYAMVIVKVEAKDDLTLKNIEYNMNFIWDDLEKEFTTPTDDDANLKAVKNYLISRDIDFELWLD